MWRNLLQEPGLPRGLIFSAPKRIRVDEWAIWTPAMLSQARQVPAFPIENPNLGAGRAPLLMSVPVAYYTTVFRPQLWGFFLFDFERGFSFYWCCKVFGLLLATGWWLRTIGLRSQALIIFGAIWIFFPVLRNGGFLLRRCCPRWLPAGRFALAVLRNFSDRKIAGENFSHLRSSFSSEQNLLSVFIRLFKFRFVGSLLLFSLDSGARSKAKTATCPVGARYSGLRSPPRRSRCYSSRFGLTFAPLSTLSRTPHIPENGAVMAANSRSSNCSPAFWDSSK